VWEKGTVTQHLDERSYEVETQEQKEQPQPRPLEHTFNPALAVTPNKEKTPPSRPPETTVANQPPSEQQTTPAAVTQHPKRNIKEPEYLKDFAR